MNITINYYRGLPLSCVDLIELTVDGVPVAPNTIYVQHRGHEYAYEEIRSSDFPADFYWVFGEFLRVVVRQDGGIDQGQHDVKLVLGTRRSYTTTMVASCQKMLTFA